VHLTITRGAFTGPLVSMVFSIDVGKGTTEECFLIVLLRMILATYK